MGTCPYHCRSPEDCDRSCEDGRIVADEPISGGTGEARAPNYADMTSPQLLASISDLEAQLSEAKNIEIKVERVILKDVPILEPWQGLRHAAEWPLLTRVRKMSGSHWVGRVVGYYSTELTPVGYCVESEREKGSVQLYPAAALKRCVSQDAYGPLDVED